MRLYTLDGKCNISGERIKSARAKAKLTQDQLAARLQVAGLQMGQMAISRIESGKRLVPDFELPIIAEGRLSRVNAQKSKNIFYEARMRAISSRKSCSEHR